MQATVKPDPGSSKVQVPKVNALGADVCSQRTWYYQKSKGFSIVKAFRNIESTQLSSTHQLMKWNKKMIIGYPTKPGAKRRFKAVSSLVWKLSGQIVCLKKLGLKKSLVYMCFCIYLRLYLCSPPQDLLFASFCLPKVLPETFLHN